MMDHRGEHYSRFPPHNLGRTAPLKDAMALIGIDSPVNEKVINEVKKLESVVNVKSLNFNIM